MVDAVTKFDKLVGPHVRRWVYYYMLGSRFAFEIVNQGRRLSLSMGVPHCGRAQSHSLLYRQTNRTEFGDISNLKSVPYFSFCSFFFHCEEKPLLLARSSGGLWLKIM